VATPTVKRLQLGNELRHLRQRAGVDVPTAGKVIERSQPVMSRLENGVTGIRQRDLNALLAFYGERIGQAPDYDFYWELNRGADQRGRWTGYRASYAKYFRMAVDLEADASMINVYWTEILPGLVQTEDYMRALFTSNQLRMVDQSTEDAIRSRMERQQVLTKRGAPEVTIVLSESSLHRTIGDRKIMREQMRHLATLARRRNIHLHVLTFQAPMNAGVPFPFAQYRVPAASKSLPPLDYVYVETFTDGEYLDGPEQVATYSGLWNGLLGAALDETESRDFLLRTADWHH
jgi:hypothetical protein